MWQAWRNARVQQDPRTRYYIDPVRIIWQSKEDSSRLERTELLLAGRDGQSVLSSPMEKACILRHEGSAPGFLLDFGTELHGGVQICIAGGSNKTTRTARLRVRFGESAMEAMSELGGTTNATNNHAVRDGMFEVSFMGAEEIGNTGFRFVRIDFLDEGHFVQLLSVRAVALMQDVEYQGSFRCNDELLNRIWEAGAYTVHLNMQDYLWDGIKRDRLVWTGDMHPEISTLQAVFGYHDVVPRSLDFIRDQSPLPGWMTTFPTYSIWWVLVHHDWYMQNGDLSYLKEQKPYMTGLLRQLAACVREDGSVDIPNPFLDWPSSTNPEGVRAGAHALFIWSMEAGGRLCELMGDSETGELCRRIEAQLRKVTPDHNGSKQAASLLALVGLLDPREANQEVIAPGSPKGYSTFYGYYILKARGEAGDILGSLDSIRSYWGGMLSLGATTFWEDFDIDWLNNAARIDELTPEGKTDVHGTYGGYCYQGYRHSLCHGWASGPTAWLSEYVLGIRPVEPGCRAIRVAPQLGDLVWAEGTYPTPYGIVKVKHTREADGSVHSEIEAPEGVRVIRN
ncbi:alpha-L-rhamnosidase C-terminal domain-containing protein [Paenibacillus sp. GD4]|uniref:alpha-L-rhamnosidase-related protein n=1 Tax=Paenibacillus sp. GD4 TaxID=3068890 RepID=UPI0027966461|nr:alpha-L-rhamnosidase C-terminal domain-containing protein [Paenibacillus sp. GD4]MDQ1914681.1 alpha-L-rhamnosidase C-terminal domain-containing protein [Paenibacillus sp. GD4]